MRKCLVRLTALFALAVVTPASAQLNSGYGFYTGNALMRLCKNTDRTESTPDFASYSECVAYLSGVIDTYGMLMNLDAIPRAICSPGKATQEQLRQAFLKYMNANPEKWRHAAVSHALVAFAAAWPCKE
jgi:hypothetical protein